MSNPPTPRSSAPARSRVLLVGLGVRGRQWAEAIERSELTDLVGTVDVDPAARRGEAPGFIGIEAALSETRPDLVVLATPPAVHAEQAIAALDLGIAVLCEKPLCETIGEAVELTRHAEERGVLLLVGMNFRFLPVSQRLRQLVAERTLGAPIISLFAYLRNRDGRRPDLNSFPLEMDQPMLYEQSVHHIDVMRFVLGREIVSVQARTWNPATSVYRDDSCVAALLEFEGDLVVDYLGTWTSGTNRFSFEWRIDFEGGVVSQTDQFDHLSLARLDPAAAITGPLFDSATEPPSPVPLPEVVPFRSETRDLLEHAVRAARGEELPGPTAADHLRTLAVLDAIVQSSRDGRRVLVEERLTAFGRGAGDRRV